MLINSSDAYLSSISKLYGLNKQAFGFDHGYPTCEFNCSALFLKEPFFSGRWRFFVLLLVFSFVLLLVSIGVLCLFCSIFSCLVFSDDILKQRLRKIPNFAIV